MGSPYFTVESRLKRKGSLKRGKITRPTEFSEKWENDFNENYSKFKDKLVKLFRSLRPIPKAEGPESETFVDLFKTSLSKETVG